MSNEHEDMKISSLPIALVKLTCNDCRNEPHAQHVSTIVFPVCLFVSSGSPRFVKASRAYRSTSLSME